MKSLISLALEKSLVESDYALLSVLEERDLNEGLSQIEGMITQNGAKEDLDTLCAANCEPSDLLWLLHWFSNRPIFESSRGWIYKPGERTTKGMLGIGPKKLRKLVAHLNSAADEIEKVNLRFQFGVLLSTRESLFSLWHLQRLVRMYASLLQYAARHFGSGTHIYHNIAKARLTSYVKNKTGNFRDKEVAALISSLADDEECHYDATAHGVWRRKHYSRLKKLDARVASVGPLITRLARSQNS